MTDWYRNMDEFCHTIHRIVESSADDNGRIFSRRSAVDQIYEMNISPPNNNR